MRSKDTEDIILIKTNKSIYLLILSMNRNQIEYILALAKFRNFREAAESCFITQSTLSTMIAKFEDQIGIEIFNRKTRPLSITPKGEVLLQSIRSISREFQLMDENINELNGTEVGQIRIACIPTIAPYLYPIIIDKITQYYPEVSFFIHELTTQNIVDEIQTGNIDIGIVSIPLENKDLLSYPLYEEEFLVYDWAKKKKNSGYKASDIDLDRLWLLEEGHCLRNQVGSFCELRKKHKINGNINYNCGSIFTLIKMVKSNKGVTLLPKLATIENEEIEHNKLFRLSAPTPVRKIGMVTHKNFVKKRILLSLAGIINDSVQSLLKSRRKEVKYLKPF